MSIAVSPITNSQFFGTSFVRLNQLASLFSSNTVTIDASAGGSQSSGNGFVTGSFGFTALSANTIAGGNLTSKGNLSLITNTAIVNGANNLLNITANSTATVATLTTNTFFIGANVLNVNNSTVITGNLNFANSVSVNSALTAVTALFGNTFAINSTAWTFGNSTVNSTANSTHLTIASANIATGNFANVNVSGDTVVLGNLLVTGNTVSSGNTTATGSQFPSIDNTFAIGSAALRWSNGFIVALYSNTLSSNTISVGNSSVNNSINSTSYSGVANNSLNLGGQLPAFYANVTAPSFTTSVGVGANVLLTTSTLSLGNSTVNAVHNSISIAFGTATLNALSYTGTSNNTLFVGATSAANVVANTQLQANLANYTNTVSLTSLLATLTANNSTNFAGHPGSYYANATNFAGEFDGTNINASGFANVAGALNAAGVLSTALDSSGSGGQFRAKVTNYGVILRNDDSTFNIMATASGNAAGTFSSLRPFGFNLGTGVVTIDGTGVGTIHGGGILVNNSVNAASLAATGSITSGPAIAGNGSISLVGSSSNVTSGSINFIFGNSAPAGSLSTNSTSINFTSNTTNGTVGYAFDAPISISGVKVDAFASGTAMLFVQAAAPTGWTKSTLLDNYALRITSGTGGGTGGSVGFTTAMASQAVAGTVGGTAITTSQMPSHNHGLNWSDPGHFHGPGGASYFVAATAGSDHLQVVLGGGSATFNNLQTTTTAAVTGISASIALNGGGATHTHTFTGTAINMAVQYVNAIICTKN